MATSQLAEWAVLKADMLRGANLHGAGSDEITASDLPADVEAAISLATTAEQKHFADFAARISRDPDQARAQLYLTWTCAAHEPCLQGPQDM